MVHRKSSLSVAISAALFAAFATSAAAAPQAATPADSPSAQTTTTQSAPASDQAPAKKPKSGNTPENQTPATLSVVNVVGVRASQMRAIELKRVAPNIQDSITAESIGQLPDVTITDALQRVTGVQINRDAGVGTSVDVRGLPEVGTMLNGEVFITPNQIDSQQPDFEMLPATLFRGVDVIKSPTANMLDSGISGDLNLHTYRPWDLPNGFTYS
jgi:outer membrane receptor protein involved in Fe transport